MKNRNVFFLLISFAFFSCEKKTKEPVDDQSSKLPGNVIELTHREQVLVNLHIDTAKIKTVFELTTLLGKAAINENNTTVISSRVNGRLDKLFVRNPGEEIKKGQALYSIYSEELLSEENEYLLALAQQSEFNTQKNMINDLMQASQKKLLLWGLNNNQIEELVRTKKSTSVITFYSNAAGYLAELNISEGEYVETGTTLFRIAESNSVWVEAQVYPAEVKYLNQYPDLSVEFESLPNEVFIGKIAFDPPSFEQNSKITFVRIEIQNKSGKVKPGMMASVILKRNKKKTLMIPKSAITLGKTTVVWVEIEKGKYQMKEIHTGIENKTEIEVLDGIMEGEKVVTSGAYLINSAYILKNGAKSMGGMKM
jgi:Cu(I)/Ag(I) efflux system membrane fusion protein